MTFSFYQTYARWKGGWVVGVLFCFFSKAEYLHEIPEVGVDFWENNRYIKEF